MKSFDELFWSIITGTITNREFEILFSSWMLYTIVALNVLFDGMRICPIFPLYFRIYTFIVWIVCFIFTIYVPVELKGYVDMSHIPW